MSIKIMAAIWELDLPQSQKLVALAFGDFANDHGDCWPSIELIAWKCGYSERQTQAIAKKLRKSLILEPRKYERGGRGRSTVYRIHPENGAKIAPFQPKRVQFGAERVKSYAQKGEVATAPEPSGTISKKHPPKHTPPGVCEEAVAIWNGECGLLPKVRELTAKRSKKISTLAGTNPEFLGLLREATRKAAAIRWPNWTPSFDWMVENEDNYVKVLEGNYDRWAAGNGGSSGSSDGNRKASGAIVPPPGKYKNRVIEEFKN